MRKLKTSLIDHRRIQYRGFSHLHVLIYSQQVKGTLRQRKAAKSLALGTKPVVVVTNYGVLFVLIVIKTRAEEKIASRHEERLSKLLNVKIVIEYGRTYEVVVVSFNASEVEEERSLLLHEWTTQIHVVLPNLKWRALAGIDGKRVLRS